MLSQAVGYGISALSHIAAAGGKAVLVKEVAEAASIPAPYLAKIIHSLAKRGLVNTQRGVGGGVTLARPATEISLFDVCVALNDPVIEPTCMLGNSPCSDARACPAHKFWTVQRGKVQDFLQHTSVADFAVFDSRRRWRMGRDASFIELEFEGAPLPPSKNGHAHPAKDMTTPPNSQE